jgi:hypothetical protein
MTASRLRIPVLVTAGLFVGAIAQAQQPSASSGPTTAAAQSPAAAASQPAQKAAVAKPTEARSTRAASAHEPADASAQFLREASNAGFKPTTVRGAPMFCRTAVELGSNFPVRTCYNEEQTKVKIQEYEAQRNQLRQGHFLPPGMPQGCSVRGCQ